MKFWLVVLLCFSLSVAAQIPCAQRPDAGDCMFNEGGWEQVAFRQYDPAAERVTIWQKAEASLICTEAANGSERRCVPYGGDLAAFRADAARETAARKAQTEQEEARQVALAKDYEEKTKTLGIGLKREGWQEITRCFDGHQWSYILEKDQARKSCRGINGLAGPTEEPCIPFTGDFVAFKATAAQAKAAVQAYSDAKQAGQVESYLKKNLAEKAQINCWDAPQKASE
jgi:hypothetical protein